jgi:2-keto-4-pentenoate hydratase
MTASESASFLARLASRGERCERLPDTLAPIDRRSAYTVQAEYESRSARPLHGWKIAATSLAGQKHIGVDGPLAGRYVAERVVPSGGNVPFGNNHMKVAEVEFGFRFARDLAPRAAPYGEQEVLDAVASAHPMIEIPDSRYDRFETVGAPALIADNACAHWLVEGEAMPEKWRQLDIRSFQPIGLVTGKHNVTGLGSNVLGSPVTALAWLVNELSALGITLRKGQIVSTGTCLVPMAIAAGDHVVGDFGELGSVSVTLTD